ncbi:MAG: hypothetical protein PHV32_00755 [Eubacteriales bacterium]|nr:hypothetical protein [Eubacteriales bacterium]
MNNQYYMLYLDEPAEPSFCSFAKQNFGTIEDIGLVMRELEKTMQYESTVNAWRAYMNGNHEEKHSVAYKDVPLLTPVECISSSELTLPCKQWNHLNVWTFEYAMRFDGASVSQAVFKLDKSYKRCIRACMMNLRYEDVTGKWVDLIGTFWGHASVLDVKHLSDGQFTVSNRLYMIEQQYDDIQSIQDAMSDPDKLIFDKICDEIFADG